MRKALFFLISFALFSCGAKKPQPPPPASPSVEDLLRARLEKDFEEFLEKARCIQRRCPGWTEVDVEVER